MECRIASANPQSNCSESYIVREPAPLIIIDPTEFAALVAVLKAIAATTAYQHERLRPGRGQEWLNIISAACQEAVLRADIGAPVDAEALQTKNNGAHKSDARRP